MREFRFLAAAAVVLASIPRPADAGGFSNPDFGIRRMGMFAVTARADDPTAIYHNPACLTLLDGTHIYHAETWLFLELGIKVFDSKGQLQPKDGELGPSWSIGAIPFLGVTSDLGTKKLRVGLAAYAPNAYGAWMSDTAPTRYQVTKALFLAPRATASLAYKFDEKFSLGASINLIYVYMGMNQLFNPSIVGPNAPRPDDRFLPASQTASGDFKVNLSGQAWTWAYDLGVMFHPVESLRIGAAFAGGSPIHLTGKVKVQYPNAGKVETANQTTDMTIPFELRFGFNWQFVKDFEVGADVYWWHYQVLQEQRTVLSHALANGLMGPVMESAKNNSNSFAWNIGLMYHILPTLELMAGWQMDFTPTPTATYSLTSPSGDQMGVGMGARWQVSKHVRIGLALIHNWFQLINVQDNIGQPPANGKGHGGNTEVGFDIDWKL